MLEFPVGVCNRFLCSIYFAWFLVALEGGLSHPIFLSALDVLSPDGCTETTNGHISDIMCNKFPCHGGSI